MVPGARVPAAVIGDLVHSPVEFLEQWDGLAEADPAMAATARHAIKVEFAAARTTVWGNHFPRWNRGCWARVPTRDDVDPMLLAAGA
jgi:hypothetical protein